MWARWPLWAGAGLMSTMLSSEPAWSQTVLVTFCNDSSVPAYVAVAGNPSPGDNRLIITGWYTVESGGCANTKYVAPGNLYFYAESPKYSVVWEGTNAKFCVDYPGPFERLITTGCAAGNLKGFIMRQSSGGQYTFRFL